jgi:hypothetical protein
VKSGREILLLRFNIMPVSKTLVSMMWIQKYNAGQMSEPYIISAYSITPTTFINHQRY